MNTLKKRHRIWYLALGLLACALSFSTLAYADDPAPGADDTGKYTLNIEIPAGIDPHVFADGDQTKPVEVSLDVSGSTVDLEDAYILFENLSAAQGDGFILYSPSDFNVQGGHTTASSGKKIVFDHLRGGDKISFYEKIGFEAGDTPNNFDLELKAVLYDRDGTKLAESPTTVHLFSKIATPLIMKELESSDQAAGVAENGYITKPREITYSFSVTPTGLLGIAGKGARRTNQLIIEDTLPTYTDSTGATRTAQIAPSSQGDWTLSADGTKATYTKGTSIFTTAFDNYGYTDIPDLKLLFPGARVGDKIPNSATARVRVDHPQPIEQTDPYLVSNTSKVNVTIAAEKKTTPLKATFSKRNESSIRIYDTEVKKDYLWKLDFDVTDMRKAKEVKITEIPLDGLYVTKLSYDENTDKVLDYITSIRGELDDGSWEDVTFTKKKESQGWWGPQVVKEITLTNPEKYSKLEFIFDPNHVFGRSDTFGYTFYAHTRFKDPDNVAPATYRNRAEMRAKAATGDGEFYKLSSASVVVKAFQLELKYGVWKNENFDFQDLTPGKQFKVNVGMYHNLPPSGVIEGRKLVAILPDSVDVAQTSGWSGTGYDVKIGSTRARDVTLINDFKGSGKRALIINLPPCRKAEITTAGPYSDSVVTITFTANQNLTFDPVDIPIYYTFDGVKNVRLIKDTIGIYKNVNGELVPDRYNISNGVANVPMSSVTYNTSLPSKVTGGTTLIGHNSMQMSAFGIAMPADNPILLGMEIHNYENDPQTGIVMYTTLPHAGDKVLMPNAAGVYTDRGSTVNTKLVGPVTTETGYTVYYLSEEPGEDSTAALNNPGWTTNPASFDDVRAIKVVADPGVELEPRGKVVITYEVIPTSASPDPRVVSTFAYRTAARPNLVEANKVYATLPPVYKLKKEWKAPNGTDEAPAELTHPDSVTIRVMSRTSQYGRPEFVKNVTLDAAHNWELTIDDLPEYDGSRKIIYSFNEVAVDGWTSKDPVLDPASGAYVFANTYKVPTIDIPVFKEWVDGDGNNPAHPAIEVKLLANGEDEGSTLTLDANTLWSEIFKAKPKVDDKGKPITYSVKEVNVPQYFTDTYTDAVVAGYEKAFNVVNTFSIPTKDIVVNKIWIDGDGNTPQHPAVTVKLLANDVDTGETITLTNDNNWTASFTNKPVIDSTATTITYTVVEVDTPAHFTPAVAANNDGFTITNTFTIPTKELTVSKEWVDGEGNTPPHNEVEVKLLANGNPTGDVVKLNEANTWTNSFGDKPLIDGTGADITYSIEETAVPDYFAATYSGDVDNGFKVTNTFQIPTKDIEVNKVWVDGDGNTPQHPAVTVKLLANGVDTGETITLSNDNTWTENFNNKPVIDETATTIVYTVEEVDTPAHFTPSVTPKNNGFTITNTFTIPTKELTVQKVWDDGEGNTPPHPEVEVKLLSNDVDTGETVKLNAENGWKASFGDKPLIDTTGIDITYKVEEINVPTNFTPLVTGDVDNGFTVTNIFKVPVKDIVVNKIWVDGDGNTPHHPEVEVRLVANGVAITDTVKLNPENNWTASFTNKPVIDGTASEIAYTVEEVNTPDNFIATTTANDDGSFTVTNTFTIPMKDIAVTKTWVDGQGNTPPHPEVEVKLIANGVDTGETVKLNEGNSWTASFANKPLVDNTGNAIDYSIEETVIPENFTAAYTGDIENGFNVTNTFEPAVKNIVVHKVWVDGEGNTPQHPEVEIKLIANGEDTTKSIKLNEGNGWSETFTDVRVVDGSGTQIIYTVEEINTPDNFSADSVQNEDGSFTVTNTFTIPTQDLKVTKVWVDGDGNKPQHTEVEVKLIANGTETGETVKLNAENEWTATFTNKPLIDNKGEAIVYSVEETKVPESFAVSYSGNITDGFTVTNTYQPPTAPDPEPDPMPDPMPDPEPDPMPDPMPDPEPDPMPDPEPDPQSKPDPEPDPKPDPDSKPGTTPKPDQSTTPAPAPQVPRTYDDAVSTAVLVGLSLAGGACITYGIFRNRKDK